MLQVSAGRADHLVMNTIACSAVARAGRCAVTASLDDEAAWPLLQVAGWLTTAADLMVEAGLRETALDPSRGIAPIRPGRPGTVGLP